MPQREEFKGLAGIFISGKKFNLRRRILDSEYIDYTEVNENLLMESGILEGNEHLGEEMRKCAAEAKTNEIESSDIRRTIRIPRNERHDMLVPFNPNYSIFYYIFDFQGVQRHVS